MPLYWESFIGFYEKEIPHKSLVIILEAFWYFCNNRKEETDKIMSIN